MRVELHIRTNKSEAARDCGCKAGRSSQRAQQLCGALALAVGRGRVERIRPAFERFTYVRELRRLGAVDCTRTDEQKSGNRTGNGELQRAPCPFDNGVEHHQRCFAVQLGTGFGRGMDDVRKRARWKITVTNVRGVQTDSWVLRQVQCFLSKQTRMS